MSMKRALGSVPAVLLPPALWFYVALRANIALVAIARASITTSFEARYAVYLVNVGSLSVFLIAWLVLSIRHTWKVRHSASIEDVCWRGAGALGWGMIAFGIVDGFSQISAGFATSNSLTVVVQVIVWASGIALVVLSARRPVASRKTGT